MVRSSHEAGLAASCLSGCATAAGGASRDFASGTTTPKYGPSLELEPTHLLLKLRIDIERRSAGGAVTTTVVARRDGARSLSLHAEDFETVSAVELVGDGEADANGTATADGGLSWTYDGHVIAIRLSGGGLRAGSTACVRVAYTVASPRTGMFFSDVGRSPFVATDHETERARYWLPCVDHPAVRTSLRFELTLRAGLTVLANGARVEGDGGSTTSESGWETTVWELAPPMRCPSYLVCIAAGEFVRADGGSYTDAGGVERGIAFFGPSDAVAAADLARTFGPTASMISWMVGRLGVPFPWPKYFQYAVGGGVGGAMENISLVSWHDSLVCDEALHAERGLLVSTVNLHEMAHTYFGDLLVIKHFDDAYLKESFANFMEYVIALFHYSGRAEAWEAARNEACRDANMSCAGCSCSLTFCLCLTVSVSVVGPDALAATPSPHFPPRLNRLVWLTDECGDDVAQAFWHMERVEYTAEVDDEYARPLSTRTFDCSWSMFDRHLYPGGAWRLHMLEELVGKESFWAGITKYITTHMNGTVETVDLRRALEATSGRNLVRWFDQWVYQAGYPKLVATTAWDADTSVASVTLRQTQADQSRRIGTFDLSVPVSFQAPSGEWLDAPPVVMTAESPSGTTAVRLDGEPTAVVIDPAAKVLHTLDWSAAGEQLLARALAAAPTAAGRIQAAVELGKRGTARSVAALSAALRSEPCWAVRRLIAAALPVATSAAAVAGLVKGLATETDPRVIYVLADALSKARGDATAAAALRSLLSRGLDGDSSAPRAGPLATAAALRGLGAMRGEADVAALAAWVAPSTETTPPEPKVDGWTPASLGIVARGAVTGLGSTRSAAGLAALLSVLDLSAHAAPTDPARLPWVRSATVAATADAVAWADRPTRLRVGETLVGIARRDNAPSVRMAACQALGRLGGDAVEAGLPAVLFGVSTTLPNQDAVAVRRSANEAAHGAVTIGAGTMPATPALVKEVEAGKEALRVVTARLEALEAVVKLSSGRESIGAGENPDAPAV